MLLPMNRAYRELAAPHFSQSPRRKPCSHVLEMRSCMTSCPLLRRLSRVNMAAAGGFCWQLQCYCGRCCSLLLTMRNGTQYCAWQRAGVGAQRIVCLDDLYSCQHAHVYVKAIKGSNSTVAPHCVGRTLQKRVSQTDEYWRRCNDHCAPGETQFSRLRALSSA